MTEKDKAVDSRFVMFLMFFFAFFLMLVIMNMIVSVVRVWIKNYQIKNKAKNDEAQVWQSHKLEAIGQLASGVAHDFNNILTGIHGAAESLEAKLDTHKELQKYTNIILRSCEKASHLSEQLLLFSHQKSEQTEPIDLHECLAESLYLLEHGLQKKISITKDFVAKKFIVCINQEHIQSLILNLGFNSRDAMSEFGKIVVKTRNVTLDEDEMMTHLIKASPGDFVEIGFCDSGSGISKEIMDKIFNPFFTTKKMGQGTGLGLPAVYGIVREYNGTLKVESSEKGTNFYLYFPVVEKTVRKEKKLQKFSKLKAKILVVDDEPVLLELMKEILEAAGSEVVCQKDARLAVKTYQENGGFDVVMLDVMMPEKTGDEIYVELKKLNPEVKVVFLSGYHKNKRIENIVATDLNTCFITKPYHGVDVVEKLGILLAKA